MKTLLFFVCYCQFVWALAQEGPSFTIKPNSKTVLIINYKNNTQVRSLFTYTGNVLPDTEFRLEDSLLVGTGRKYVIYDTSSPQRGFLTISQKGAFIYLVPGDTLTLSIDLSQSNPWHSYKFIGKYAAINQYYFDQAKDLKGIPYFSNAQLVNEATTLVRYRQQKDSLLQVEEQYFQGYLKQHKLPLWFIKKEKQQIVYADAAARVNAVNYREFIKKDPSGVVPKGYYNFITPALLNNSSAAHLLDYQRFVKDYFYRLYFQQKNVKNPVDYLQTLADKNLSGLAWEVFMTRYISELLAGIPTTGEHVLAKYYARFTNKQWIDKIHLYYQDAYTLKPGQSAPNFALEDPSDSLAYLKDFRGQIIYLSFWFTGCAPCRQEMPLENELVKYFEGKPVKIINICVKSTRADWAKVSQLYDLQTVNLYANKAWENTLIAKYNVKAYPHYVLINQDGKVVKNNCSRPSGKAKEEIEALLR